MRRWFGIEMYPDVHRTFTSEYRAFSVTMLPGNERRDVERGNKFLLPPSALDLLTRLNITYPMLFKIVNRRLNRETHCGVLEFSAEEGKCYLPYWMMKYLCLDEGDLLYVENTQLPVGTFAKFQPQSVDFLDISNPKAVLENSLRNFACLSANDTIVIEYNEKQYEVCVLQVRPGNAISIIECDLNVEFAAPVDYQDPQDSKPSQEEMDFALPKVVIEEPKGFKAFAGTGNRIDGKTKNLEIDTLSDGDSRTKSGSSKQRGVPDYRWKPGTITFIRMKDKKEDNDKENGERKAAFPGTGQTLKAKKKSP
ncbi:ubiquitin recognition factor in ER-associated degradation protein 1-like isoform X2 [Varroa destructor]|uniref:Ubiquitin fusion degradation protein 1 homolog n=1 Tax=Varroa destructor TaxID=109461 RepID=A0A7M7JMG5_VARDE|nr:ubiquitin recognition factor in ER-associated degradation protein 1-like isoform X2 [Varroa destructor]